METGDKPVNQVMSDDGNSYAGFIEIGKQMCEQLKQLGGLAGGNLIMNFVAPGAQYVNTIETQQIFSGRRHDSEQAPEDGEAEGPVPLPEELDTERGHRLLEKARKAGFLDNRYQPLVSLTQSALLATAIANELDIRCRWKVFGTFWHRNNIRNHYNRAMSQRQSYELMDRLKTLLKE